MTVATRDALAAERRRMPWLPVEKDYAFIGPEGKMTCSICSTAAVNCSSRRALVHPKTTQRGQATTIVNSNFAIV